MKVAEEFCGTFIVSPLGRFKSRKVAKVVTLAMKPDGCSKSVTAAPNADSATGVVLLHTSVEGILRPIRKAKIVEAIITRIAVDMVDLVGGRRTRNQCPDDAMKEEGCAVNQNSSIAVFRGKPGDGTYPAGVPALGDPHIGKMMDGSLTPIKQSRLGVVGEALLKIVERGQSFRSHAILHAGRWLGLLPMLAASAQPAILLSISRKFQTQILGTCQWPLTSKLN